MLLGKNLFAASHWKAFLWTPTLHNFFKDKLQLHGRCSVKKVFLKVSQNSQEYTCAGIFWIFLILKDLLQSDSITGVFLWILRIFEEKYLVEHLRTAASNRWFFLEAFRKFQKIFKSTNEKMLLISIAHAAILKGSLHEEFN